MQDVIEKLGKSIIQHGPYNRRVYLMKLHIQDAHSIRSYIECLAHNNKYEKIVAKIPSGNKADYKEHGYAQEEIIPEYFGFKKNERCLVTYICRLEDTCEMSLVFQAVFKTYLFPIFDANYLSENQRPPAELGV